MLFLPVCAPVALSSVRLRLFLFIFSVLWLCVLSSLGRLSFSDFCCLLVLLFICIFIYIFLAHDTNTRDGRYISTYIIHHLCTIYINKKTAVCCVCGCVLLCCSSVYACACAAVVRCTSARASPVCCVLALSSCLLLAHWRMWAPVATCPAAWLLAAVLCLWAGYRYRRASRLASLCVACAMWGHIDICTFVCMPSYLLDWSILVAHSTFVLAYWPILA
jgi:hypothetical protein